DRLAPAVIAVLVEDSDERGLPLSGTVERGPAQVEVAAERARDQGVARVAGGEGVEVVVALVPEAVGPAGVGLGGVAAAGGQYPQCKDQGSKAHEAILARTA